MILYKDGEVLSTTKSENGTITNLVKTKSGEHKLQVKTKDGKYYEKDLADWEADKYKLGKQKDISLNPKKWGLNDYSDYSSYNSAFRNARESKEKEFTYKDERYNTNLIPKKDSDLYWESKKFLKNYYETQPYAVSSAINGTSPFTAREEFLKKKYGYSFLAAYDKRSKFKIDSPEWNKLSKVLSAIGEEEDLILKGNHKEYNDFYDGLKKQDKQKQVKERLKSLDKPSYFSVTSAKPLDMLEEGYWDGGKNKTFMYTKGEPSKLNTTFVHELSHKGDDIIDVVLSTPDINVKALNESPFGDNISQSGFNYLSDPSEIEARKLSTLFFLKKHKLPWEAGKISPQVLDKLYDYHFDDKLPSDIDQLLELYGAQPEDLLNYLNGNYDKYKYKHKYKKGGLLLKYR